MTPAAIDRLCERIHMQSRCGNVMTGIELAQDVRAAFEALVKDRDEWRTSASKACETPADGCDCSGCRFAADDASPEPRDPVALEET